MAKRSSRKHHTVGFDLEVWQKAEQAAARQGEAVDEVLRRWTKRGAQLSEFEERIAWHFPDLTPRQRQVVYWMAQGYSHQAIADRLGIAVSTTRGHASRVYQTLGVDGRRELLAYMARLGIFDT
jgi:DNA-binding NarL/FixJ family response regulator